MAGRVSTAHAAPDPGGHAVRAVRHVEVAVEDHGVGDHGLVADRAGGGFVGVVGCVVKSRGESRGNRNSRGRSGSRSGCGHRWWCGGGHGSCGLGMKGRFVDVAAIEEKDE